MNFTGASMKGVVFNGMDLRDAVGLTQEQVNEAYFINCVLPDGLVAPDAPPDVAVVFEARRDVALREYEEAMTATQYEDRPRHTDAAFALKMACICFGIAIFIFMIFLPIFDYISAGH